MTEKRKRMLWLADNDEKRIARGVAKGDKRAMRALYALVAGSMSSACRRYITQDDDAQDVVQDAFLSIITHISDFVYQGKGSLRAWATRIAVNQALNFLKRQQQQPLLLNEELLGDLADDDSPPDLYAMDADRLHALIRSLPDGYRTVFNLYAIEGKSHREIAALLGIKENTSASQYHRAKAMLARQIKQYLSQNSPLP
ncbi:MAG: RNA polymerase sigma factor [Prevotella sp.]